MHILTHCIRNGQRTGQNSHKMSSVSLEEILPLTKTVKAQNGRQKQLCRINCEVVNIYQLSLLPKEEAVENTVSAIFPDISSTHKNNI